MKLLLLNILKTKYNSVQEMAFLSLSRTLLYLVVNIFQKKNFTSMKSTWWNNLRFCHQWMQTYVKTKYFWPQVLQTAVLQHHWSPFRSEKQISEESLKRNSTKIPILPGIIFLSDLVIKVLNILLLKGFLLQTSLEPNFLTKCGF